MEISKERDGIRVDSLGSVLLTPEYAKNRAAELTRLADEIEAEEKEEILPQERYLRVLERYEKRLQRKEEEDAKDKERFSKLERLISDLHFYFERHELDCTTEPQRKKLAAMEKLEELLDKTGFIELTKDVEHNIYVQLKAPIEGERNIKSGKTPSEAILKIEE